MQAHVAAVCCLEVNSAANLLMTGGKEGRILLLKVENEELVIVSQIELCSSD